MTWREPASRDWPPELRDGFCGDRLLEDIAADVVTPTGHMRLSQSENRQAPAVKKVL